MSDDFSYEHYFKVIPQLKGNVDYLEARDFGSTKSEKFIKNQIFPFLSSRNTFKSGADTPIGQTARGRHLEDLYSKAFNKRSFFFDLETTGDAQKTDKARVYQATLYHYDPNIPSDEVKHFVTNDIHALDSLSKNRGLKPGEALTYYFNLGDKVDYEHEPGLVPLPKHGRAPITYFNDQGKEVTTTLRGAVYRGTNAGEAIQEEGKAFQAIFRIFGMDAETEPGAVLNVHNSNFDFAHLQNAALRDKSHNTGEEIMERFPSGKSSKSSKRMWANYRAKKKIKNDPFAGEEIFNKKKNSGIYRLYGESNSETDSLARYMTQRARVARRTDSVLERNKNLKEAQSAAEWFVEKHLNEQALHTRTIGSKAMIADSMNIIKASYLLLQKHGHTGKRGDIALGTSLDLLSIAQSGMPITHLDSTDITRYGNLLAKNEYENFILPMMANGKLNIEGKRQMYVRERLMKLDKEKNIADSIYARYLEAINQQKIKVTGAIGLEPEMKPRVRVDTLGEIIDEQISFYTQPQTVRTSRILDKPIRESLEAEHGKDSADIIQRYIEKIDKEYQKKYWHDMSNTIREESPSGDVRFIKEGYGSGDFKTMSYDELNKLVNETRRETRETFKSLKTLVGSDLYRKSKALVAAGLDPSKAGKVLDVFEYIRPAFMPISSQVEEMRVRAETINNGSKAIDMTMFGEAATAKTARVDAAPTLISYLKRRTTSARTSLLVGAVVGLGALMANSRAEKMMTVDSDQKDFQDRFDFYLNHTGASIGADGSEGYEGDVLSSEDKESYSGFDSLNIYKRVLNTDFESPFKAPTVSLPMAKEKMAKNVIQLDVNRPKLGYNVSGGQGILADLNRQAQVANHKRLQGHYNMLQTDYNLDG